jgi:hypothetical protein
MQQTYAAASKGAADFNLHLIDIAQTNMNAALILPASSLTLPRHHSF